MAKDAIKEIVLKKKERILLAKQAHPEEELKSLAQGREPARPFIEAISKPKQICLIAELKKASPSRGVIRENFNVQEIAQIYKEVEAQAISVLPRKIIFRAPLPI